MRVFNYGFIVFFMAMLMLPLVFVDLSSDRVSVEENRMLAERPNLADMRSHPGAFVRNFDAWFKDSTGFRKQLIKLYQVIDRSKWLNAGVRYTDGNFFYLVGQKGHRYFANEGGSLIQKFQGKPFLSDEQLANMANKLEMCKAYLDSKGIPLVVMFCTDKETIYPEFYPKSIIRGPEPIQLDVITDYIRENTSVDVFNIRQALLAEKDSYPLYNLTDDLAHYSEIGAFFAYRELMKHINVYFPEIVPYELSDVDIKYDEKGIPSVFLKAESSYRHPDYDSVFEGFNMINFRYATVNTRPYLPVILSFCSSYSGEKFIGRYLSQHFGIAISVQFSNLIYFKETIDRYKPDIVVFESAEFTLRNFAYSLTEIPKLP